MADNVALLLIPFNGDMLALTPDQYQDARARAGEHVPPPVNPPVDQAMDRIVTAEQAEQLTSVPATWFAEAMRKGTIPHFRFGKYPRMRFSEVLAAVESRPKSTAAQAVTPLKSIAGQRHGRGR